jgi:hypothetical protein
MANHNYELFISFLGDSPILPKMFPITAPSNISVSVLKERVYAERQNRLKGIGARNLILWKVLHLFLPSYNVLTLSNYQLNDSIPASKVDKEVPALGQDLALSAIVTEMMPKDDLSDHFPVAPQPKHLHVIVQSPQPGK